MSRFWLAVALVVAASGRTSALPQDRPSQADGVVRLLADLETALTSGRVEAVRAVSAQAISPESVRVFDRAASPAGVTAAAIRERGRSPKDGGYEVLADVMIARGRSGRLATWVLDVMPRAGAPSRYELRGLTEAAALDGLLKLTMNAEKQYSVHNFSFTGPDLTVKMRSGTAFVAEDDDGITGIVLRGDGQLHFAPPDPAEQGQMRVLAGRPTLTTPFDSAFIRLNSNEFDSRVAAHGLVPEKVDPSEVARARVIFDDRSSRTYTLDLQDLSADRWSIAPSHGGVVVEFRTNRWGWLTYVRAPGDAEDVVLFDRTRGRTLASYATPERLESRGTSYSEDASMPYDITRYDLDLTFSPDRRRISGRATLQLTVVAPVTGSLTLKLAESLTVTSVTSPEFGRLLALRVIGQNNLIVNMPSSLLRGKEVTLDIVYAGRLLPQPTDSTEGPGGHIEEAQESPVRIEPEPRLLYSNQVYWYPQALVTDYATAHMKLRVPSEYQLLASGSLVGSTVGPSDARIEDQTAGLVRTLEYVTDRPARYFACVISRFGPIGQVRAPVPAIAPAQGTKSAASDAAGTPASVNVEVVSTPKVASRNRQVPAKVADILKVYADIMGQAPYPSLTVAGIEDNLPGGHSPAFISIWLQPLPSTPYTWLKDPLALDNIYPPHFLAHEIAHQWWGQAVGWKNYHEQWLSEGLAQYFATVYAGADRGPAVMRQLLDFMRDSAMQFSPQGPIALGYRLGQIQSDTRVYRAIVYNKSALVLHMLRRLVGDDKFFASLRRYYTTWRFQKAGTEDLRAAFEAETGLPLKIFFDRWIRGSSLPRLRVSATIDDSGQNATVKVEQIGDVFELPLTLNVQYLDGSTEDITIPVMTATSEHRVPLKGRARRIEAKDDLLLGEIVK